MSKELVFKVVLRADTKDYVSNVKQSEASTKAVFDAIKQEANKLRQSSEETSKKIGEIIPKGAKELADALTTSLTKATGMIENAGAEASITAKNFTDLGVKSNRALEQLKIDLTESKQKLSELSTTDANPKSIAIAQNAIAQLENEVMQAEAAFNKFEGAVLSANKEVRNTESASLQAQKGIDGLKTSYSTLVTAMAAIGVGVGIKELIKTADTYTNLSARIKIAIGDTGNFEQALAGVHQTAVLTNSNLDSTAALFTQLTYVGKELGLIQNDVLGLTKTITQAVQTGGGSAQATDAAITQLIQSLNSGRLAGEEFNSVSEQAPVIIRALSKELGVTTSELRKMAENGDLTSRVVIRSLQNQAKVIDEEYKKLPITVEKALQRIQTQWQITIGEINNSNGTTETIAKGLLIIADNLDIVRKFIDDVGVGFNNLTGELSKGIDASTIESFKNAISSAYDAVKQLASTLLEFGSDVIDGVGTALTTIASIFSSFTGDVSAASDQVSILERAFQGISIILGFISDGLYAIKIVLELLTGSFFGLAAGAYKALEAITWGGVSKQFANNADVMLAKAKEYFSEADKDAIEFQSQGKKRADEAIQTEQQKQQAIRDVSKLTLDKLLADQNAEVNGKKQSESEKLRAVQEYAEAAIKANGGVMDGTVQADLMTKGYIVTMDQAGKVSVQAWNQASKAADDTGKAIENAAKQGAQALGIDLDAALNKVSRGFQEKSDHVNDLAAGIQRLGVTGDQAAAIIYHAWSKWLETAKSQAEIDAAKVKLEEFEKQGVFSTKQVEMGMLAIKHVTEKLPDDLDEVGKAFDRLGVKTKEQLKLAAESAIADFNTIKASGQATSEGIKQAYERVMQAAAASGDQAVIANAKAQGASVGLQAQIDETGKSSVQSTQEIVDSLYKVGETARGSAADGFRELGRIAREEAKSTADEWIDAMAKVDAKRKAQAAETAKGLGQLADGQNQMAQNFYDQLIAGGIKKGRAEELKNEAITRMNNQLRTALNGGSVSGTYDAKIGRNESQAWMQEILDGLDSKGSIGSSSPKISAPNIEAPSIQQFKMPNIETGPSKTVTYRFEFGGQDLEFQGDPSQQDMVNSFFNQLEQAKKRM
ncbi:tape measure protein [Acinetobacter junii]|uniref:tape measure protein n=1 Tax=Acinetobacter junii TaxID=40215 RepID=UPI003214F246